jgi:hypothetical protein
VSALLLFKLRAMITSPLMTTGYRTDTRFLEASNWIYTTRQAHKMRDSLQYNTIRFRCTSPKGP